MSDNYECDGDNDFGDNSDDIYSSYSSDSKLYECMH